MRLALIAVILCASSMTYGQSKDHPTKGGQTETSTQGDQRGSTQSPLVVEVSPSSKLSVKTETDPDQERTKARNEAIVSYSTLALAAFTFFLAAFTAGLMVFTFRLWKHTTELMKKTDDTTKVHERAYVVCGGVFGSPKYKDRPYINDAADYGPPWRMQIHNFGRTPGFITKVEWGVCPVTQFPLDVPVSKIIKRGLLRDRMKPAVEIQEVFAPMGQTSIPYRHVTTDRVSGEVFFGRITYTDIFDDEHFSTFALLHDEHHTTPIGRSFSDDWK